MPLNTNILLGLQPANAALAGQAFQNSILNIQRARSLSQDRALQAQAADRQAQAFEQQRLLDPIKLEMAEQQVEQGRRLAANQAGLEIHNAAKALRSIADPAQREATLKIMAPELINRFGLSQEDLANGLDDNELDAVIAKTQMFAEVGDPIQERFSPKTVFYNNGTSIQGTSTGNVIVKTVDGIVTGEEANKAIQEARESGISEQGERAGARRGAVLEKDLEIRPNIAKQEALAKDSAKLSTEIFQRIGGIESNISNMKEGVRLVDEGAATGPIAKWLPSLKASSIKMDNLKNRLGLDVIGSVTFGALSEKELKTAFDTAVPSNLKGEALKQWFQERIVLQEKLLDELESAGIFLSEEGATIPKLMAKRRQERKAQEEAPSTDFDLEYDPATGAFK